MIAYLYTYDMIHCKRYFQKRKIKILLKYTADNFTPIVDEGKNQQRITIENISDNLPTLSETQKSYMNWGKLNEKPH